MKRYKRGQLTHAYLEVQSGSGKEMLQKNLLH